MKLYTTKEAAELLRMKPAGVYKMVNEGKLIAHKPGRDLLFKPKEIEDFIERSLFVPKEIAAENLKKQIIREEMQKQIKRNLKRNGRTSL